MRRIVSAFAATVTALVLLFSYHTSTNSAATPGTVVLGSADPAGPAAPPASGTGTTVEGDVAQTRWGPVQVAITVEDGTITEAHTVQEPDGNQRDVEINAIAVPTLNAAVVQAQSAQVDTVSGATVTSEGYLQSLQSAIDKANL